MSKPGKATTKARKGKATKVKPAAGALPQALAPLMALNHWVVWRWETNSKGKPTKVPYQPCSPNLKASTSKPSTWASYAQACQAYTKSDEFMGIGFVLTGSEFAAFDIDDCRDKDTETIHPWAQQLVERVGSYTEVTVSGTGLRIIGQGSTSETHRKLPVVDGVTCEVYRRATRYIVMTGDQLGEAPIINIDKAIDEVVGELDKPKKTKQPATPRAAGVQVLPRILLNMLYLQGEKPAGYPTRSELLWAFICDALRQGIDENVIVGACLDENYAAGSIYNHVSDNGGEAYVKKQIERAIKKADDEVASTGADKVIIRVEGGKLHEIWRATEHALVRAGCPVFVRADALVQPLWRWEKTSEKNRDSLVTHFVKMNVVRLSDMVAHHAAEFQKFNAKQKRWKNIDPPKEVIETLLEAGHWAFKTVAGIVNAPTMRPDGSLLTEPGYDEATQLWYKPAADIELPPIPECPTEKEAEAALKLYTDLLVGFPLVGDVDKAVAVAGIMTVLLRGAFKFAPMFFIWAPKAGTGKSYLVKVISTIATGRDAAALVGCQNVEELEKRLTAAAFQGMPILHLNNLTFDLESALLSQMITEEVVMLRKIFINDRQFPCNCTGMTIFANGNEINISGADLVRRTLTARLNTKTENPEKRTFTFDPVERVLAARGAYLAAAFTIARAYMAAGCPKQEAANIAGFEDWSRFVRYPLMWLGMADPALSTEEARMLDPQREAFATRMTAYKNSIGIGKEFTAAEIYNMTTLTKWDDGARRVVSAYPELFDAFSGSGKNITVLSIGKQLSKDRDKTSNGYTIEMIFDPKTHNRFKIVEQKAAPADSAPANRGSEQEKL